MTHDYEGFGGGYISEHEGFESVREKALFIEENPAIAGELLNHFGGDIEEAQKAAEECYSGCYKSLAHYAEELTTDTSEVPENLAFYIDYERMGRDMELNGDVFTPLKPASKKCMCSGRIRDLSSLCHRAGAFFTCVIVRFRVGKHPKARH